ncbi:MAG: T9SS type A sorting domain-containing protein, partial [Ignavibacteriales bacterium]|nr:T9SS type A sorting domain-containing protein [Ignavibacteriales bacterium]
PPPTGGPYYYAVTGLDRGKNESDPSGTITIAAPSTPLLATPADGSVDQPLKVSLFWHTDPQVATYELQVATDSTFASGVIFGAGELLDTSRTVVLNEGPTRYFWRVRSSNGGGIGPYSAVRNLTGGFPAAPLLSAPAHGLTDVTTEPTFVWNSTGGADSYQFQLSTTSLFTTVLVDTASLTDTTFSVAGLEGSKNHFWRVRASNNISEGLWSQTNGFRTGPAVFVEGVGEIPAEFVLHQNYPNPFNPNTRIAFSLPAFSHAALTVYDILGREVSVLVDEELAAGYYSVGFDAGLLPSGTYVAVLRAGEHRAAKKMLLLK